MSPGTVTDDQAFSVYLGNVPADVVLEDVWANGKQLGTSERRGYSVSPVVHGNGSRGYELRLSFEDPSVQQTVSCRTPVEGPPRTSSPSTEVWFCCSTWAKVCSSTPPTSTSH